MTNPAAINDIQCPVVIIERVNRVSGYHREWIVLHRQDKKKTDSEINKKYQENHTIGDILFRHRFLLITHKRVYY